MTDGEKVSCEQHIKDLEDMLKQCRLAQDPENGFEALLLDEAEWLLSRLKIAKQGLETVADYTNEMKNSERIFVAEDTLKRMEEE